MKPLIRVRQCLRRRLVSLSGFHGFRSQLNAGECLILEYESLYETELLEITSEVQFNLTVYGIDGCDIYGFWAADSKQFALSRSIDPTELTNDDDEYPFKSTIHRPVEDIVLGSITHGFNLNVHLELIFGPYRRF